MIRVETHGLKRTRWWEHAIRFVVGGSIALAAGLVAKRFGPAVGGLFLAFPSILPASLTLLASHHGRDQACDDARGSSAGGLGLVAFAGVTALTCRWWSPTLVLVAAFVAWLVTSVGLWAALVARRGEDPPLPSS